MQMKNLIYGDEMRTEKEIIDMFVRVADCFSNEEYKCPFIYTCVGHTDDSCKMAKKGEIVHMDKNRVLEIAFETIKDSTEWGIECEDKSYGHYVDGIIRMTDNLLDEFNKKNYDMIAD